MSNYHISVLRKEAIDFLNVKKDEQYIDATVGGGGHTVEILRRGGRVLGIDVDEDALAYVQEKLKIDGKEYILVQGNFRDIDQIAKEQGIEEVARVLFDVGVSSHQLDTPERGFSFQKDADLDMRMSKSLQVSAKDLVNGLGKNELADLFFKLGEEPKSRIIARKIVERRKERPITKTKELASIVTGVSRGFEKVHPATRVFQALRIAVNDELYSLEEALPKALKILQKKGRIVVITFHSLEDRIVKNAFDHFEQENQGRVITNKPVEAGRDELEINPRARSAKIRVFEKI